MTIGILLLTLAYVGVAALLLNLNLATRHGVLVKSGSIVLVTGLYAATWYGHRALSGWASPEPVPDRFRVHWIVIEDPDKSGDRAGALYFWLRELDEAGVPAGPPRAHELPWSKAGAKASQRALERLVAGERLNGKVVSRVEGVSASEDASLPAVPPAESVGFEFSRVPPPALPPKGLPRP